MVDRCGMRRTLVALSLGTVVLLSGCASTPEPVAAPPVVPSTTLDVTPTATPEPAPPVPAPPAPAEAVKSYKKWIAGVLYKEPGPACRLQTPEFTEAIIDATVKHTAMGKGATCAQNVSLGGSMHVVGYTFNVFPSRYAVTMRDTSATRVVLLVKRPGDTSQEVVMVLEDNIWKVDRMVSLGPVKDATRPQSIG